LRRSVLACAGLLALACASAATTVPRADAQRATLGSAAIAQLSGEIAQYQKATWHWQRVMGVTRTPTEGRVLATMNAHDVRRALLLWQRRAAAALRTAQHPPQLHAWLCIHRYEGSWTDGGAPYYGGLQMDVSFQETYGPWLYRHKGTADHWTPLEQIWTAVRASRIRGFWPWPNTARFCGLM